MLNNYLSKNGSSTAHLPRGDTWRNTALIAPEMKKSYGENLEPVASDVMLSCFLRLPAVALHFMKLRSELYFSEVDNHKLNGMQHNARYTVDKVVWKSDVQV